MGTTYNLSYTTKEGVKCMAKEIKFAALARWVEANGDKMTEYRIVQYDNGHARKTYSVKNY